MALTPGRRRAEQLAVLLESGGRTDDPVLEPFLALGEALRAVPAVAGPAPEFRAALRQRLVAVATVQGAAAAAPSAAERLREVGASWRFQRRMAVVAGGAAAATAIAGVGLGASRSLPGDAFYGIKRATEDVQLATTVGQEAKGKRHLEFARTRLTEVAELVDRTAALPALVPGQPAAAGPRPDDASVSTIVDTLHDMDAETRAGTADLVAVYRSSGNREPLEVLNDFSRDQFSDLRDVLPALPVAARPRARASLALLAQVAGRTVDLTTGGAPSVPTQPGSTSAPPPARATTPASGKTSSRPAGTETPDSTETPSSPRSDDGGGASLPTAPPTIPPLGPTSIPSLPLPTKLPTLPALTELPLPDLGGLGN